MITEICLIAITVAFIALVIFLMITFRSIKKTVKQTNITLIETQKDLSGVSRAAIELLYSANDLTLDIKKKSESLNFLFHSLVSMNESKHEKIKTKTISDKISEVVECVGCGIVMFNKIKEGIEDYVKHR